MSRIAAPLSVADVNRRLSVAEIMSQNGRSEVRKVTRVLAESATEQPDREPVPARRDLSDDMAEAEQTNTAAKKPRRGVPYYEDAETARIVQGNLWEPRKIGNKDYVPGDMLHTVMYVRMQMYKDHPAKCECRRAPHVIPFWSNECKCSMAVFTAEPGQEERGYYESIISYEQLSRLLTAPGLDLLRYANKKHPKIAVKVPPTWHKSYLKEHAILRIRATNSRMNFLEGECDKRRHYPLDENWMNSAVVASGAKIPEATRALILKHQKDRWWEFESLPSGCKLGQQSSLDNDGPPSDSPLSWAMPAQKNTRVQKVGSFHCIPFATAALLDSMSMSVLNQNLGRCANHIVGLCDSAMNAKEPASVKTESGALPASSNADIPATDKRWFQVIESAVADWGKELKRLDPASFCPLAARDDNSVGYVFCLKSDAYPHGIACHGELLFDPAEDWVLENTKENHDEICGGKGRCHGVLWAFQISQSITQRTSDILHRTSVGPQLAIPLQANMYCCGEDSNKQQFLKLCAAAAFDFGLQRVAKILHSYARKDPPKRVWDSEVCRALSSLCSFKVRYSVRKKPTYALLKENLFGVANFRHDPDLYIGFCGNNMFVAGMPNAVLFVPQNLQWVAGGHFCGFERAGFVHAEDTTPRTKEISK